MNLSEMMECVQAHLTIRGSRFYWQQETRTSTAVYGSVSLSSLFPGFSAGMSGMQLGNDNINYINCWWSTRWLLCLKTLVLYVFVKFFSIISDIFSHRSDLRSGVEGCWRAGAERWRISTKSLPRTGLSGGSGFQKIPTQQELRIAEPSPSKPKILESRATLIDFLSREQDSWPSLLTDIFGFSTKAIMTWFIIIIIIIVPLLLLLLSC